VVEEGRGLWIKMVITCGRIDGEWVNLGAEARGHGQEVPAVCHSLLRCFRGPAASTAMRHARWQWSW
jgi:hypothetical protein